MEEYKEKFKNNLDWKFIISGLVLAFLVGLAVYGARKANLKTVSTIMAGGK